MAIRVYEPQYDLQSPYHYSSMVQRFLTYYVHRPVDPNELDQVIQIVDPIYDRKPDLFAADHYGDDDLFWVIPVRNGFQDPVFDFRVGRTIIFPHPSYVRDLIGGL